LTLHCIVGKVASTRAIKARRQCSKHHVPEATPNIEQSSSFSVRRKERTDNFDLGTCPGGPAYSNHRAMVVSQGYLIEDRMDLFDSISLLRLGKRRHFNGTSPGARQHSHLSDDRYSE
jgi:hypothetical protein